MVKRARKCDVPQDRNIVKNDLPNIHSIGQAITGLALLNFTTGEDSTLWVGEPDRISMGSACAASVCCDLSRRTA